MTRRALADIASARADARPYYFDLGSLANSWPRRQHQDKTPVDKKAKAALLTARLDELKTAGKLDEKSVKDAYIDIYGDSSDDDMIAALAGLVSASSQAAAAPAPPPAAPAAPVADAEEEEEPSEEEVAEAAEKKDAKIASEADARADAMCVSR